MKSPIFALRALIACVLAVLIGSAAATPAAAQDLSTVAFEKVNQTVTAEYYTTLSVGPDRRLYGTSLSGRVYSWAIADDGTISDEQELLALDDRLIIGLLFDQAAAAENPVFWITHTDQFSDNPGIFSGSISKVTKNGDAWELQDYVVGLPRSLKDHLTNSMDWGPDGAMYVVQGGNTAMGDRDEIWGMRPETLMGGAVLRVDVAALDASGALPLDVTTGITEPDGSLTDEKNYGLGSPELADLYDPTAPGAAVTLYATGYRNAYDLVWHSNGQLYVPVNGSNLGGNTPGTPDPLPIACEHRLDAAVNGPYTGPPVPAIDAVPTSQHDYLMRIIEGGYYGHPNPTRCQWVLNGGNPTAEQDPEQAGEHYPVGLMPDRAWLSFAYHFGEHVSPNGIIEYKSDTFGGALKGRMIVTRYTIGDDLVILDVNEDNLDIKQAHAGILGMTLLGNPLDIAEDQTNGALYVSTYGTQSIALLRPREGMSAMQVTMMTFMENPKFTNGAIFLGVGAVLGLGGLIFLFVQRGRTKKAGTPFRNSLVISLVVIAVAIGLGAYGGYNTVRGMRELERYDDVNMRIGTGAPEGKQGTVPSEWEIPMQAAAQPAVTTPTAEVATTEPAATEVAAHTPDPAAGGTLYADNCAVCHGPDAKGIESNGVNLVDSEFVHGLSDDDLVAFIIKGRNGYDADSKTGIEMPAYGGNPTLTPDQFHDVVAYLRSLGA
jgi:mono/diheme cytochrome c family protein/glucose/arabinose dehydrogenase